MKKNRVVLILTILTSALFANANAAVSINNTTSEPVSVVLTINNWIIEDIIPAFSSKNEGTPLQSEYINYGAYFVDYVNTSCSGKINLGGTLVIKSDKNPVDENSQIICEPTYI